MKVLMNAPYLFSRNVLTVTSQLIVVTFDRYVVAFDHCTFYWLQSRHKTKASKNILPHNEQTRQGCHRENFSCTQVRKNQIRQLSSTETAARCSWFRDEWEIVCVKFSRGGQFSKKKKKPMSRSSPRFRKVSASIQPRSRGGFMRMYNEQCLCELGAASPKSHQGNT